MKKHYFSVLTSLLLSSTAAFGQYNQDIEISQIRTFGGIGLEQSGNLSIDGNGNQYIIGRYRDEFDDSNGVTDDGNGTDRMFVQKSDFNGNILWTKLITGSQSISPAEVDFDSDNNAYIFFSANRNNITVDPAGANISPDVPFAAGVLVQGPDLFIWKINEGGSTAWVKTFGGNNHDYAKSLTVDDNNDLIISGNFRNQANFQPDLGPADTFITDTTYSMYTYDNSPNGYDGFVAKLDSAGQSIWQTQFTGFHQEMVFDAVVADNGNIAVAGYTQSSNFAFPDATGTHSSQYQDGFVGILDANGNGLDVTYITGNDDDFVSELAFSATGDIYAAAHTASSTCYFDGLGYVPVGGIDAFLIKYSPTLSVEWNHTVSGNGNDRMLDITISNEGNIFVAGSVNGTLSQGGFPYGMSGTIGDAYILSLDPSGSVNHFSITGHLGYEAAQDVKFHTDGTMFILGEAEANVVFEVGTGLVTLDNEGSRDIFVAKGYDCKGLPTPQLSIANDIISSDQAHGINFEWLYDDGTTVSIYPSTNEPFLTNPADDGLYALVITHGQCDTDTTAFIQYTAGGGGGASLEESELNAFNVYPNPTSGLVYIQPNGSEKIDQIIVEDMNGRVVLTENAQYTIDLSSVEKGFYFARIVHNGRVSTIRLVKK